MIQLLGKVGFFLSEKLSYASKIGDIGKQREDLLLPLGGRLLSGCFGLLAALERRLQLGNRVAKRSDSYLQLALLTGHRFCLAHRIAKLLNQLGIAHQDHDERHQEYEDHNGHDVGKRRPDAVLIRATAYRGGNPQIDKTVRAGNGHCACCLMLRFVKTKTLSQHLSHFCKAFTVALHLIAVAHK